MKEKTRTILFIALLLSLSLGNILNPIKAFSNKENRYLQGLPELNRESIFSGRFAKEFETFTTDQFVGRDGWISLKTLWDLAMLKKDNSRVYFGKEGYLFDTNEEIDEKQFDKNLSNINIFLNKISKYDTDISTTILLVPTKGTVLKDKLPVYAPIIDEKAMVDRIKSNLEYNLNLRVMDLSDVLENKSQEYIYYKTDHHWTTHGTFYAYEYYLNEIGITPLKKGDFIIDRVSDEFLGTSYRKANFYLYNPDKIYRYIPDKDIDYDITINNHIKENKLYDESYLNKTDKYSYFLGGDKSLIEIDTSVKNGKTILVIKDSFANSFIPFLGNHYEKIIVIDPRYFRMSMEEFMENREVDEILFLFNIQNFAQEKSFHIFSR